MGLGPLVRLLKYLIVVRWGGGETWNTNKDREGQRGSSDSWRSYKACLVLKYLLVVDSG